MWRMKSGEMGEGILLRVKYGEIGEIVWRVKSGKCGKEGIVEVEIW